MPRDPSTALLVLGAATAAGAAAGWVGGPAGLVGVALVAGAAAWGITQPGPSALSPAPQPEPVAPPPSLPPPSPPPEPPEPEDASASGLEPLPIEPTEARDPDEMGLVWRAALDACIDGLLITGPEDEVLYANPAVGHILASEPQSLLGVPVDELFPDLGDEESSTTAGYRRTGKEVLGIEYLTTARRTDGTSFPAEITINPLGDQGMGVYQVRDVTDRVTAEEKSRKVNAVLESLRNQALDASRAKSTFLANMSHELRTPLNAILGYSEMLSEELEDPGSLEDVRKIRAAGRHLMSLINTILDLSKIEAGRMELFMETLSVELLVREVETLARPLAEENANAFAVTLEGDPGRLVADQVKLRQVLLNLLGNAFKFTESGTISLRVRRVASGDADWLEFDVVDDGIGISPEQLGRVFDEFDQGDSSTSRKYGGSGLGLSISRRFCRMMGGDVHVESVEGEGSTFTVRLPANTVEVGERAVKGGEADVRVLVVDDDPGVRELMARTLAGSGYQVLTASTGDQALARAKSYRPHVITLDVMMPGMDGWSVLGRLKEEPELRDVPVVMVSMVDERRKGYALGATAYLTKPIDRARLVELVSAFRAGTDGLDVLVVDDDPDVRELVRRTLANSEIHVREAEDGHAALSALEERRPGLVLLDLMMPGMDGFELLDAIGQIGTYDELPVIVLSALDLTAEQKAQLESRVEAVLEKGSCSQEELLRLVRDRVTAHALERAGASSEPSS
ncbi:MAG: response regulator [Alphaproteobacteria bacterium]|nr:response regulator [Alphaproteobacteria bacterium]